MTIKRLVHFILILSSFSFSNCVFHSSKTLLKNAECSEFNEITIGYRYAYKFNTHLIELKYDKRDSTYFSPPYFLKLKSNEEAEIGKSMCEFIELLKHSRIRCKKSKLIEKKQILNDKDSARLDFGGIGFRREKEKDELNIGFLDGIFVFGYIGESYRGLGNHSDKLWIYASNKYFKDLKVQEKLIEFANKMIVYKNEKIKKDTSIPDSLKQQYPLIMIPAPR